MKIKFNVLIIAIVLTVIVFTLSTYMQKKLIKYEAKVTCLVLAEDIYENELISEDMFKYAEIPISIVASQKIVTNYSEIDGLYSKDNIKKGQIVFRNQFDTKENLLIYEAEEGKEKISIKIKNAENGISFQIQENSFVNIYATMRNDIANNFLNDREKLVIGDEYEGYTVIKLIDDVKVLGVFNSDGLEYDKYSTDSIDSILISVNSEDAKIINLIRDIATFNVTGINKEKEPEYVELSGDKNIISGESADETNMSGEM